MLHCKSCSCLYLVSTKTKANCVTLSQGPGLWRILSICKKLQEVHHIFLIPLLLPWLCLYCLFSSSVNPPAAHGNFTHPQSPEVCPCSHTLANDFHAHQNGLLTLSSSKSDVGLSHQTPQGTGKFAARSFLLNGKGMLFLPKAQWCPNSGDTLLCLTPPNTFKYQQYWMTDQRLVNVHCCQTLGKLISWFLKTFKQ